MSRPTLAAALTVLALLACAPADERSPSLGAARPTLRVLSGAPVEVAITMRHCAAGVPRVTAPGGGARPEWLQVACVRIVYEGGFIGNPGYGSNFEHPDIPTPGAVVDPCAPRDLSSLSCITDSCELAGYVLRLTAGAAAPEGTTALELSAPGCGPGVSAPLALEVVGATDLGGFCAPSAGAACAVDEDCVAACGSCGDAPIGDAICSRQPACADLVDGITCGCAAGACAWHARSP